MKGKVFLVGAGPGDPELLTLKALRVLKTADVVLHDELIGAEILGLVPKSAQLRAVGKRCGKKSVRQEEINALLIQFALLGLQVVRLKGGDPLLFGRAGEEIGALRQAGIEFEIVSGVTAAMAAAAAAQIPLTHRALASALVILTGHYSENQDSEATGFPAVRAGRPHDSRRDAGATDPGATGSTRPGDWPASLPPDATVVVYMPGYHYENTARGLQAAGLTASTPCAIISKAASAEEAVHRTTLEFLSQSPRLPAPTLLVVGEVVRFADHTSLRQRFSWAEGQSEDLISLSQEQAPADSGNEERSE